MLQSDALTLTIVYLRLWKLCDLMLQDSKEYESAKFFEIARIDQHSLQIELESFAKSGLDAVRNATQVLDDIKDTLDLARKSPKTGKDFAVLNAFRGRFQQKALRSSGDLKLAVGGAAV